MPGAAMTRLLRTIPLLVALTGVLVYLPSLRLDFILEDFLHLKFLETSGWVERTSLPQVWRYRFFSSQHTRLWWTSERLDIHHWRPLGLYSLLLDRRLFGRNPLGFHATQLALWGLLLASLAALYRRLGADFGKPPLLALLAGLCYALQGAHAINVGYVSNGRYALLCALFSIGALLLYHRYRREGRPGPLYGCLLLLGLGLLSGELAIGAVLWVLAYECCLGLGTPAQRAQAAAPVLLLGSLYLTWYKLTGHGTSGMSGYVDPLDDPGLFLKSAFLERLPLLMLGTLTPLPPTLSFLMGEHVALALAWILGGGMLLLLLPHLRRDPVARFMALGAGLSMLPAAATTPGNRLLLFPAVGGAWVLASFAAEALARPAAGARALGTGILACQLLVGPAMGAWNLRHLKAQSATTRAAQGASLPEDPQARILLLSSPDPLAALYLPDIRWCLGKPMRSDPWALSFVPGVHRLTRTAPNAFRLEPPGGFLGTWAERFFSEGDRLAPGRVLCYEGVTVTPGALTPESLLRDIQVSVDRPLDGEDVWLLAWNGKQWARVRPPALGQTLEVGIDPVARWVMDR